MAKWMGNNLNIFAPFQPVPLSNDVLIDQYLQHTNVIEEQVDSLISDAQELLDTLGSMDKRLDTIAAIAAQDGVRVVSKPDGRSDRKQLDSDGGKDVQQGL